MTKVGLDDGVFLAFLQNHLLKASFYRSYLLSVIGICIGLGGKSSQGRVTNNLSARDNVLTSSIG